MSQTVIRVEGLGKRYRIGERERYLALRDVVTRALRAPTRLLARSSNGSNRGATNSIWALKDVFFEIQEGEVVGVIGRNGAGKSTLLKILARITRPTEGSAEIRGRVGSLLEVGTGFHPELTGRENVYLNGAILGMKKAEIQSKFDEIVAFSEVERFLDTPLKHYSTGMQMRLAFAVAAHLEPEILLVDEVLAVGDANFQRKCIGKMADVAKKGRTILFVSHNMDAVTRLCSRGILVANGRLLLSGSSAEVVSGYLARQDALSNTFEIDYSHEAFPEGGAYLLSGEVWQEGALTSGSDVCALRFSAPWCIKIRYRVTRPLNSVTSGLRIADAQDRFVFNTAECFTESLSLERSPGDYEAICHIPQGLILPGEYSLDIGLDVVGGLCLQGLRGVARWRIINDDPILGRFQDGRLVGVIGSRIAPWTTRALREGVQVEE
jgi:lipopolysaccharide transport system ATP-binding protein